MYRRNSPCWKRRNTASICKRVFDRLSDKGTFNLTELDWNAFDLRHVTPVNYDRSYERTHLGWLQGINAFLRKTPAASLNEKGFF